MTVDVATYVGPFPFRHLDHHDAAWLTRQMDRMGIEQAWVGHLPSFLYRDPSPAFAALLDATAGDRLLPVPTVHPGLPHWDGDVERAKEMGAPAVRVYPQYQRLDASGDEMRQITACVAAVGLALVLTVRFEDRRQRHPLDRSSDLPAAAVRALVRSNDAVRVLVVHADRSFIEEVHFGLTPAEAERVLWDISWIWGPPEHHLRLLLETVGTRRFALGTGMPLRIPDAAFANLDLAGVDDEVRVRLLDRNLREWLDH